MSALHCKNRGPGLTKCLVVDCQSNCCAHYPELPGTHVSVFGVPHGEIPLLPKEAAQLESEGLSDSIHKLQDGFWYLKVDADGRCPFLEKDGKCSRHLARFASCRSYPYFIEKYAGLVVDISCPGVEEGAFDINKSRNQISAIIELMQSRIDHLEELLN